MHTENQTPTSHLACDDNGVIVESAPQEKPTPPICNRPNLLYAGFSKRFWAFIVDIILARAIAKIFINAMLFIIRINAPDKVLHFINLLIILLYFTLMTYLNSGQTIGKMIFSLRVITLKEEKPSFLAVFIREFVGRFIHLSSGLWLVYILTAFTPKKQNLSDLFIDTSVVDLTKEKIYTTAQSTV